jgi:nitric oxide reductase activation protein
MGLTEIRPKYNNFDGYAIRYAQKLLDKRGEAQKIMIVVSDGLPACRVYGGDGNEGVKDTKSAIREAKAKGTTVVGVLIGNEGLDKERVMYDGNFLHVTKPKDLFQSLGKSLKKMMRDR